MDEIELMNRITTNKDIFGGKPIIKNRRIAVEHVVAMLDEGASEKEILEGYPFLTKEDIEACRLFKNKSKDKKL